MLKSTLMNNRIEQFTWPSFLPERLNPYRDLRVNDIDGFLKLVGREKPGTVSATVLSRGITFDGIFTSGREKPDFYKVTTEFTASAPINGYNRLIRYSEHYSGGQIHHSLYSDEEIRTSFLTRAQLSAINRLAKIKAAFPSTEVILNALEGSEELSEEAIEDIRRFARENHLSPLLI